MKKKNDQKQFTCRKLGFTFHIIINGTTTTAIITDYQNDWDAQTYIGVAKLDPKDTYDFKTGKYMAMKIAIAKYHSDVFGRQLKALYGFQRKMIEANYLLGNKLDERLALIN